MSIDYSVLSDWDVYLGHITPAYRKLIAEEGRRVKAAVKHLGGRGRFLDDGCGSGRVAEIVAPHVGEYVGLEHEYRQLKAAEKANNLKNVRFIYSDMIAIPFPEKYFDVTACLFSTISNQGNDRFKALQEMKRVTKPGGDVILSAYAENAAEYQMEFYKKIGVEEGEMNAVGDMVIVNSKILGDFVSERFSMPKLRRLFADNGFPKVRISRLADFAYFAEAKRVI
jgi:ubiquinone/menaquinone biosynthesis C-methylase UbiE